MYNILKSYIPSVSGVLTIFQLIFNCENRVNNVTESNSNELKLDDIPKEIEEADKIYRKKTEKIITEGLELFSRYFRHIWD